MEDSNPAAKLSANIEAEKQPMPPPQRRSARKVNITGLNQYHPALDEALSGGEAE